jgi:glycosyltransferase involved in cell wall biosynthesis
MSIVQIEPQEITVIVPTRNESNNISTFLASIPPAINVVMVDASDDDTCEIARLVRTDHLTIYPSTERIAGARHFGAQMASTPWLLFSDADVHFEGHYFNQVGCLPRAAAYYGPKLSGDEYQGYYRKIAVWQKRSHQNGIPAVSGSNFIVNRQAYFDCGGFDCRLLVNEDSELGWRLPRRGYNIHFASELVVFSHDNRRLKRGTTRKTLHSIIRCSLLYFNLIPAKWRTKDWGYWS